LRSVIEVDVAVMGAGPSGCAAVLRLLALGRSVALIECLPFPRPQIGESLSAGVWGILQYLDAVTSLDKSAFLTNVPAQVAWESREARLVAAADRGAGLMVDRADFDTRLVALAESRGALRFQPARVSRVEGEPGAWRMTVSGPGRESSLDVRMILDARGRSGRPVRSRHSLGPATIALWAHVAGDVLPRETRIEAIDRAWFWGAPLPDGRYRVMAFVDPTIVPHGGDLEGFFRGLAADARLFERTARAEFLSHLAARSATPYLDLAFWHPGSISIGEKALALDPLSSSGVEKSMRLTLQAVIAANTVLHDPASVNLAQDFYETRLLESATVHASWTRAYYALAWPNPDHAFWRDRSSVPADDGTDRTGILARLREMSTTAVRELENRRDVATRPDDEAAIAVSGAPTTTAVTLSSQLRYVATPCAVNDLVQMRLAVAHPSLTRPVVFLGGIEVAPLLRLASDANNLGEVIECWARFVPAATAVRILLWLLGHGILQSEATSPLMRLN
jgi:flavin-dependent dehydrogenase